MTVQTSKCQSRPKRKCQRFPVIDWLIRAVFSGREFLGMLNAINGEVQNGFTSCFAAKQELQYFPHCNWLIFPGFTGIGFYGCWMQRSSSKWLHFLFSCQTESASIFLHLIDRFVPFSQERGFLGCPTRWWRLKCENVTNPSVTGRKILNFTIAFSIPRNPLPEKTAWINQYMTGKCWHFLFGPFWRLEVLPLSPSALKKGSHILIGSNFV